MVALDARLRGNDGRNPKRYGFSTGRHLMRVKPFARMQEATIALARSRVLSCMFCARAGGCRRAANPIGASQECPDRYRHPSEPWSAPCRGSPGSRAQPRLGRCRASPNRRRLRRSRRPGPQPVPSLFHRLAAIAARRSPRRSRMARFSAALALYQHAISSIVRRQPRQVRVRGSIRQMPRQGETGVGSGAAADASASDIS